MHGRQRRRQRRQRRLHRDQRARDRDQGDRVPQRQRGHHRPQDPGPEDLHATSRASAARPAHVEFWNWIKKALDGDVQRARGLDHPAGREPAGGDALELLAGLALQVHRARPSTPPTTRSPWSPWRSASKSWPWTPEVTRAADAARIPRRRRGARPSREAGLRNDVAAFLGLDRPRPARRARAGRGPAGVRRVVRRPATRARVPRAVAAYFANGGEVAWVVRAGRGGATASDAASSAVADGGCRSTGPARLALPGQRRCGCTATSPGDVGRRHRACGSPTAPTALTGEPELDLAVEVPGEPPLRRAGLRRRRAARRAIAATGLVTAAVRGPATAPGGRPGNPGPAALTWTLRARRRRGAGAATRPHCAQAIEAQAEVEEVALVCVPGPRAICSEPSQDDGRRGARRRRAPPARTGSPWSRARRSPTRPRSRAWRQRLRRARRRPRASSGPSRRTSPWLLAEDLRRPGLDRYPPTDPVGHVCGVDRPARPRARLGLEPRQRPRQRRGRRRRRRCPTPLQALALAGGVNLVRGRVGGGLEVWGARTLDTGDGPLHRAPPAGAPHRARGPAGRRAAGLRHQRPSCCGSASPARSAAC